MQATLVSVGSSNGGGKETDAFYESAAASYGHQVASFNSLFWMVLRRNTAVHPSVDVSVAMAWNSLGRVMVEDGMAWWSDAGDKLFWIHFESHKPIVKQTRNKTHPPKAIR